MWQRQPIGFDFSLIGSDGVLDQMMTLQYREENAKGRDQRPFRCEIWRLLQRRGSVLIAIKLEIQPCRN